MVLFFLFDYTIFTQHYQALLLAREILGVLVCQLQLNVRVEMNFNQSFLGLAKLRGWGVSVVRGEQLNALGAAVVRVGLLGDAADLPDAD